MAIVLLVVITIVSILLDHVVIGWPIDALTTIALPSWLVGAIGLVLLAWFMDDPQDPR